MSLANYELWYLDDIGNRIAYIDDVSGFEYTKILCSVGVASFTIPFFDQIYNSTKKDRRIAIYRQPENSILSLETVVMLRDFTVTTSGNGQYQRGLYGVDLNELLNRRIVAYYAEEAESLKTDYADDMMKEIVTENMISNADYSGTPSPSRSMSTAGLSVQSDLSEGPSITKAFAWRNVLTVLQDIQADTKSSSDEVFFNIYPVTETTMQFRTFVNGRDRTSTGNNPIVFSMEWGNLLNPKLTTESLDEANFIYAGGRGEKTERIIQTASDITRITESITNQRESFAYSRGETDAAVLSDAGSELERQRPFTRISGELLSTPLTPYGGLSGWNLGDLVTVSYAGLQFDVIIRAIHVQVFPDGSETIKAKVEL